MRSLFNLALLVPLLATGCALIPEISHEPVYRNPFPQLSRVAIAPFFNLTTEPEPEVDGRQFALAYFNELQSVPGFEVVPIGVVETKAREYQLSLASARDVRKLAQLLEVDAVVIGAITDFSPYYPPRCSLRVEWYAANPCFHPIPPGYGLPLGTPLEEEIPEPLIFEAAMAHAQASARSHTPPMPIGSDLIPVPREPAELLPAPAAEPSSSLPGAQPISANMSHASASNAATATLANLAESDEPVIRHTNSYNGNDRHFTDSLKSYAYFRDEQRSGGWTGYLQRSDDFIRFCCHLHIAETLTARGGAAETRVLWRWSNVR